MDQFLANATNTTKARWDKLPTSIRWLLFLPLTSIASILVWLVVGSFTLLPGFETGIANTLANAIASAAFTVCFIWCCLHLPPE